MQGISLRSGFGGRILTGAGMLGLWRSLDRCLRDFCLVEKSFGSRLVEGVAVFSDAGKNFCGVLQ